MLKPKDCRAIIGGSEYFPLMIGGMGVDISTSAMVLEAARLGCIAHLSDAVVPAVCDKNFGTTFTKNKVETASPPPKGGIHPKSNPTI